MKIRERLKSQSIIKNILIIIMLILVSSSIILAPFLYLSENHFNNSTSNINDLRGASGLQITELIWDNSEELLLLNTNDGISLVDDKLNYQFSLNYSIEGSRSSCASELLGIYDSKLFAIYRISYWDILHHSELVSWDLNTKELLTKTNIGYFGGPSLSSDSSKLVISGNNSVFLIELRNPDLFTEIVIPNNYTTYVWINSHQLAFFYSDRIINYDTDNHTTVSSDTISLNYYRRPQVISEDKFLFYSNSAFIIFDQLKNDFLEIQLAPRQYFRDLTINYLSDYIVGSVYMSGTPSIDSLIFWDTEGNFVKELLVPLGFHSVDWNGEKQKLAGAAGDGNFTLFSIPSIVLDVIKNKNYLISISAIIQFILIIYVLKKYLIRRDNEEEKDLYPQFVDN